MTKLLKTISEVKAVVNKNTRPIGLVPTMGALHKGHISLIEQCVKESKMSFVSIFVNPTQFSQGEDFEKYPRELESDLEICSKSNVDYVFAPSVQEIYSEAKEVEKTEMILPPENLSNILCGKTRKNHFSGVATVVRKLFGIFESDFAYFGKKDLQQLYVVNWLVNNYKSPTLVKECETIREANGLAYSSRNKYLAEDQKVLASNLYKALKLAKQNARSGLFTPREAILESLVFLARFSEIKVEYFDARSKEDLKEVLENTKSGFYFLLAARVCGVRLIDNIEI